MKVEFIIVFNLPSTFLSMDEDSSASKLTVENLPVGILSTGEDIADSKDTLFTTDDEKFRILFENVQDVITYSDNHGKILAM